VEAAYRALAATLGRLSEAQIAMVEQVYALASHLDRGKDSGEPLSAMATVSRELRLCVAELRNSGVVAAAPKGKDSVDEVRQRRERRVARGRGSA